MFTFLQNQNDFICFAGGFAFFVAAVFALYARFTRHPSDPWSWLAAAGIVLCAGEWIRMPACAMALPKTQAALQLALLLIAFTCVMIFAAASVPPRLRRRFPPWAPWLLLVPPLAAAARSLPAALPIAELFTGTAAMALAALAASRIPAAGRGRGERPAGAVAAAGFWGLAAATGLRGAAGLASIWTPSAGVPAARAELLLQSAVFIAAGLSATGLWMLVRRIPRHSAGHTAPFHPPHRFSVRGRFWMAGLVGILVAGWLVTDAMGRKQENRKREALLEQGATAAAMIDPALVESLSGSAEDLKNPAYDMLKARLVATHKLVPKTRFVYLVARRPDAAGGLDRLVILADSEPPESPDYSPPGDDFQEAREEAFRALITGASPTMKGPYTDRWGSWVTPFCPIRDPVSGKTIACLSIDIPSKDWQRDLQLYRLVGICVTFGVCLSILAAFLILQDYRESAHLLEVEERKFEAIFQSINDAIVIHDLATGDILAANQRAGAMLGYKPEELAHPVSPFAAHEPPYDGEHADAWIRQAVAGEPQLFEWLTRNRSGQPFWVEVNLRRISIGNKERLLAVIRNIDIRKRAQEDLRRSRDELEKHVRERTAELAMANADLKADVSTRMKIEKELRESEARFRAVTENIHSGILIFQDLRLMYANPGAERITGFSRAELRQSNFWTAVHPDFREELRSRCAARQRGEGGPFQQAVKITHKDGTDGWIFASAGAISYGGRTAVMLAFFDVTEQHRLDEERNSMAERSMHVRKLESLGAMAGGIAHDFNNLLATILGNTDLLLAEHAAEEATRHRLEEILAAGQRAAAISDKMLAFAGRRSLLVRETVEIGRFLRGLMPFLANFASHQIDIASDIPDGLPPIKADVNMIRQMIVSLITNAAEAIGEKNGRITLAACVRNFNREELDATNLGEALPPGRFVAVQVGDTGPGMDAVTKERLFDPFFTTKFIGRGMGMPAVLGMMRSHGGAIGIDSSPGAGSRISLLFPCTVETPEEKVPDAGVHNAPPATAAVGKRPEEAGRFILVVDDEQSLLRVVEAVLRKSGFDVRTALDGALALEIFRREPQQVAAVILDLSMPGMPGRQVLTELHKISPAVPVILTSGYSEQEATSGVTAGELAGFLKKPYRLDTLADKLRAVLGTAARPTSASSTAAA